MLLFLFIFLTISLIDTSGLFLKEKLQRLLYVDEDAPDIHKQEKQLEDDMTSDPMGGDRIDVSEFEDKFFKGQMEKSNEASPEDVLSALDKIYQKGR